MTYVIVKQSRIHVRGVFANRDYKAGEVVLKWDMSHRLTLAESKKLPEEEKPYIAFLEGRYTLLQIPERYVNHSCEANTHIVGNSDVALRNIKKGEEITANYEEDKPAGFKMKCNCGSKKCRKIIG